MNDHNDDDDSDDADDDNDDDNEVNDGKQHTMWRYMPSVSNVWNIITASSLKPIWCANSQKHLPYHIYITSQQVSKQICLNDTCFTIISQRYAELT